MVEMIFRLNSRAAAVDNAAKAYAKLRGYREKTESGRVFALCSNFNGFDDN